MKQHNGNTAQYSSCQRSSQFMQRLPLAPGGVHHKSHIQRHFLAGVIPMSSRSADDTTTCHTMHLCTIRTRQALQKDPHISRVPRSAPPAPTGKANKPMMLPQVERHPQPHPSLFHKEHTVPGRENMPMPQCSRNKNLPASQKPSLLRHSLIAKRHGPNVNHGRVQAATHYHRLHLYIIIMSWCPHKLGQPNPV
jgi:hypothetical protein